MNYYKLYRIKKVSEFENMMIDIMKLANHKYKINRHQLQADLRVIARLLTIADRILEKYGGLPNENRG